MSDPSIPLSALARFHREAIVPDVERIVGAAERRLRDEMHTLHDAVLTKLDRLEFEYQAIKAGLVRVEARLEAMERQLGALESDHQGLVASVHRLDERLSRVEKRLDELVAARLEYASRAEIQDLRARVDALQARIEALERRVEG